MDRRILFSAVFCCLIFALQAQEKFYERKNQRTSATADKQTIVPVKQPVAPAKVQVSAAATNASEQPEQTAAPATNWEDLLKNYHSGAQGHSRQIQEALKEDPSRRTQLPGIAPAKPLFVQREQATPKASLAKPKAPELQLASQKLPTIGMNVAANVSDSSALVAFYEALNGTGWSFQEGWLVDSVHLWYGVTLNAEGRVEGINLAYNGLSGSLPDMSALTNLMNLSLQGNDISGAIHPSIGTLESLVTIDLSYNQFSGALPDLFGLFNLEFLNLGGNQLTEISGLGSNLPEILYVNENRLTFEDLIPYMVVPTFSYYSQAPVSETVLLVPEGEPVNYTWPLNTFDSELTNFFSLYLNGEPITSSLEGASTPLILSLGTWECYITNPEVPDLTLYASLRIFEGEPTDESDSLALVDFYWNTNGSSWFDNTNWLEGPVSSWYGITVRDGRVVEINLSNSFISGEVPGTFANLSALETINFGYNYLSGGLSLFTGMPNLQSLLLRGCDFYGGIPVELTELPALTELDLFENNIEGSIPASIYNMNLILLDLSWNQLTGGLTESIGNLTSLEHLGLSGNYFEGNLPSALWGMTGLRTLWLGANMQIINQGVVPAELANLVNLERLFLGANQLTEVPAFVFEFEFLWFLEVPFNDFSGFQEALFAGVSTMPALERLNIQSCKLSGALPESINNISGLIWLDASNNNFDALPVLVSDTASYNFNYNRLSFDDLLSQTIDGSRLWVSGQQPLLVPVDQSELEVRLYQGEALSLDITQPGEGNFYEWYGPEGFISSSEVTGELFLEAPLEGYYYGTVINETITSLYDMSLYSGNINVNVITPVLEADSLALVQFYNENNGANWSSQDGWLTEPVELWEGVAAQGGRVTELSLYGAEINGPLSSAIGNLEMLQRLSLSGADITSLPAEIGNLSNLQYLELYNNQLTTLPSEIGNLTQLLTLSLQDNEITGLPESLGSLISLQHLELGYNQLGVFPSVLQSLSSLTYLNLNENEISELPDLSDFGSANLYLEYNRLDFGDLEPYTGRSNWYYNYQEDVSPGEYVAHVAGEPFSRTITVGGSANTYQWYADGELLEGQTSNTIAVNVSQAAALVCMITNELIPNLILYSGDYFVNVPKDTAIAAPALIYSWENDGSDTFDDIGMAVSGLDLSGAALLSRFVAPYFADVDPVNGKIYFTQDDDDEAIPQGLLSVDFNGANLQQIPVDSFDELEGVAVDYENGHVYFTDGCCSGGVSFIRRINTDGTNEQVIVSGLDDPIELKIDRVNGKLYWSDFGRNNDEDGARIMRSNLDGTEVEELADIPTYGGGLLLDPLNGAMFWQEWDSQTESEYMVRADLNAANASQIFSGDLGELAVTLYTPSQKIYFAQEDAMGYENVIRSMNYDGSELATLGTLPVDYVFWMYALEESSTEPVNATDSLALVALYNATGGTNWTNNTNWLQAGSSVRTWHGVTVTGDRVTRIALNGNNLSGSLPSELTSLTALEVLELSGNGLSGSVPAFLQQLTALRVLVLGGNQFGGSLPNIGNMSSLEQLDLSHNQIQGSLPLSLGTLTNLKKLDISYNQLIGLLPIQIGALINLEYLSIAHNKFEGALITAIGLMQKLKHVDIGNNFFSGTLPTTLGGMEAIVEIRLDSNRFEGQLPTGISEWLNIQIFDITSNQLSGSLSPLAGWTGVQSVHVARNRFDDMPALALAQAAVDARHNSLDFGDFERNASRISEGTLQINPQDSLFDRVDSLHAVGAPILISFAVEGSGNTYQWLFDGAVLQGQTQSSLTIENPDSPNEGEYVLRISNPAYPGLQLITRPFNLKLSSLERDRRALTALYNATNGSAWSNRTGWTTEEDLNNWFGVTVVENRVTRLELPSNNLDGPVPAEFVDLTGLQVINLAGNSLRSFRDISRFPSLQSVDIRNNRLAFVDIIPNRPLAEKISYVPQKRYGETVVDTVQAGSDYIVSVDMPGTGVSYQWSFGPLIPGQAFNNDVVPIEDANSRQLLLENMDYDKQGTYVVTMAHALVPDLVIISRTRNIWAKTDLAGSIYTGTNSTAPLTSGDVVIYRVSPDGPHVKEDSTVILSTGEYEFKDLVLGDFMVLVRPNRDVFPNTVQTYYEQADLYENATILPVRERLEDVNIQMVPYEEPVVEPTGANFDGVIETELPEGVVTGDEEGRIAARRKVQKAGCSVRRFAGSGRNNEDEFVLFAYVESDDEGRFSFSGIPDGRYRINIQYPGVPMDPNSDIEFEIGGDEENQKFELAVEITENGIVVQATKVLFTKKPYLKNLRLYPSPTPGPLSLEFEVYRKLSSLKMEIWNLQGTRLHQVELDHRKGVQRANLDLTAYEAGVYFVVFTDDEGTFRQQVKVTRE